MDLVSVNSEEGPDGTTHSWQPAPALSSISPAVEHTENILSDL